MWGRRAGIAKRPTGRTSHPAARSPVGYGLGGAATPPAPVLCGHAHVCWAGDGYAAGEERTGAAGGAALGPGPALGRDYAGTARAIRGAGTAPHAQSEQQRGRSLGACRLGGGAGTV